MQTNNTTGRNDQDVNIIDILLFLLSKWKWFVVSVIVFGSLAWFQYARTPKTYFRSATVIIKDPSNKISSAGLDRYDNYINKVNVANEILQFRSKKLMREVVSRVNADIDYKVKDGLQMTELYKKSPVSVRFLDTTPETRLSMVVTPLDSGKVIVSDFGTVDGHDEGHGQRGGCAAHHRPYQLLHDLLDGRAYSSDEESPLVGGRLLRLQSRHQAGGGRGLDSHPLP